VVLTSMTVLFRVTGLFEVSSTGLREGDDELRFEDGRKCHSRMFARPFVNITSWFCTPLRFLVHCFMTSWGIIFLISSFTVYVSLRIS